MSIDILYFSYQNSFNIDKMSNWIKNHFYEYILNTSWCQILRNAGWNYREILRKILYLCHKKVQIWQKCKSIHATIKILCNQYFSSISVIIQFPRVLVSNTYQTACIYLLPPVAIKLITALNHVLNLRHRSTKSQFS